MKQGSPAAVSIPLPDLGLGGDPYCLEKKSAAWEVRGLPGRRRARTKPTLIELVGSSVPSMERVIAKVCGAKVRFF